MRPPRSYARVVALVSPSGGGASHFFVTSNLFDTLVQMAVWVGSM